MRLPMSILEEMQAEWKAKGLIGQGKTVADYERERSPWHSIDADRIRLRVTDRGLEATPLKNSRDPFRKA